jgi:hypothetical protein
MRRRVGFMAFLKMLAGNLSADLVEIPIGR